MGVLLFVALHVSLTSVYVCVKSPMPKLISIVFVWRLNSRAADSQNALFMALDDTKMEIEWWSNESVTYCS